MINRPIASLQTTLCSLFQKRPIKSIKYYLNTSDKITSSSQLNQYQHYLSKHNLSLKKPHAKLQNAQGSIIKNLLDCQKYSPIIDFLAINTNLRLCNLTTTSTVDKILAEQYAKIDNKQQYKAAYALISFRQDKVFKIFSNQVEKKIRQSDFQAIGIEQLTIYLFGQFIINKNIRFLNKINEKHKEKTLQVIQKCLIHNRYRGPYLKQFTDVTQYINLLLNPHKNKIQKLTIPSRKQSLLEIDTESFLNVLGHKFKKQISVNNYKVDFIVDKQAGLHKQTILQVNGNYHYTLQNKLKGRQILKYMIINEALPVRIVHHQDFLLSRGHRNKQAYIQKLLDSNEVNWQCKNKGMDSGWQVIETQNL